MSTPKKATAQELKEMKLALDYLVDQGYYVAFTDTLPLWGNRVIQDRVLIGESTEPAVMKIINEQLKEVKKECVWDAQEWLEEKGDYDNDVTYTLTVYTKETELPEHLLEVEPLTQQLCAVYINARIAVGLQPILGQISLFTEGENN